MQGGRITHGAIGSDAPRVLGASSFVLRAKQCSAVQLEPRTALTDWQTLALRSALLITLLSFELVANATSSGGLAPPIKEPSVPFRDGLETAATLPRSL
jgi:hypothetical protein